MSSPAQDSGPGWSYPGPVTATLNDAVAAEVRAEVARQGLTRSEVVEKSGVNQRTYSRYFVRCDRSIPIDTLALVAQVLNISLGEILRRAEERLDGTSRADAEASLSRPGRAALRETDVTD